MKKLHLSSRNACVVGEAIVFTGGAVNKFSKQCWKISLQTLQWARLPDLNVARVDHAAVCVGKQIYVLGGRGCDYQPLQSVEYLDEQAGAWCMASDMPIPLNCPLAVNYNNCIYVFGGRIGGYDDPPSGETFVLETDTKAWSRKTKMPKTGDSVSSLLKREKIYLQGRLEFSGYDSEDYSYYFMAYDPEKDQWHTLSCPSYVECLRCSVVWKERILSYGFSELIEDNLLEQYNPDTDTWSVWEHQLPNKARLPDYTCMFGVHLSNKAMRTRKKKLSGQTILGDIDDVISSVRTLYDNA